MKRYLAIIISLAIVLSTFTMIAAAETTTVTVPVTISGEYNGTNHWTNATYSFDVIDGAAADYGWISNGEYKFMYYPATGQIKNAAQTSAFDLEAGKGIPEYIVIPTAIGAFRTDYAEYADKTIVLYSNNTNYAIFRYSANANTNIVIPEGVTTIPSNVFGQNEKNNTNQNIILPSTLTTIKANAFAQSSGGGIYKNFIFPEGLTSIEGGAFSNCRNTDYVLPKGITTLNAIFTYNRNLKNVTFKGNILKIPANSFRQCTALTSLTFEGNTAAPIVEALAFNGIASLADFTVYYPANATGFTDPTFQAAFPIETKFERLPGEPVAENLILTGKTVVEETLTAEYDFIDPMGREESGSTVTWTSCENADFKSAEVFTLKTESINGSTPFFYTIQETDDGKYIRCTVTPRNADTTLNVGTPVSATTATSVRLPNTVPAVTLTSPSDGYYASVNSAITLSATATCDLTTITKIEFYINGNKVGEDAQAPYEISWTPAEMGNAAIYAKAYNALGEDGLSETANVNVLAEGADLSSFITTTFTSPAPNSVHLTGTEITFEGTTSETSGAQITSVELFDGASSLGYATITAPTDGSATYGFSLKKILSAGNHSIVAVIKSADGKSGGTQAFNITVSGMKFTNMIADDMVLQRNKPLKLSGLGVDGTVVTAKLLDKTATATVSGGKWTVNFPPMPTTKSTTLTFEANDGSKVEFKNIAIGEVIMCSGQSNMTSGMGNSYSDWRDKDYADIRMFFPPNLYAESSSEQIDIPNGQWKVGTQANAKLFSMVGWLTARNFYDNTNGEIPVGLIWAATSGTSIQVWMPNGTYNNDPDLKKLSTTGVRYNALVAPWIGFTIGHVLWYQGESNSFHSQNYEKNMTQYVDTYRKVFDDESMKFTIVQLPTYDAQAGYNNNLRSFTLVREGQYDISKHIEGVGTVISIDTGVSNGIHPGDKLPIGVRAARVIQHFACPEDDIVWQSPDFDRMEIIDGKAVLYFKNIAGGLKTTDGLDPTAFKLADNNGVFNNVAAKLVGNTVEIDVSDITGEVKIRYAYEDVPAQVGVKSGVNLVNSEGFPMAPFRTDMDRTHFNKYDATTATFSEPFNFAPMIRFITATGINQGKSKIIISARDYDDSIQSVEVFVDGVSVGNANQSAYDTWVFDWTSATEGVHQIHAIATDELGTTSTKGDATLGSISVTPVKYAVSFTTEAPSIFGLFTNLNDVEIGNFGGADGVKITTTAQGKLVLAAYGDNNVLVKCKITDDKEASFTAEELEGAKNVKAFVLMDATNIKPVGESVNISK
ncbi:MAG: Ig-like domain-containing protein [Eubacteriales bacterium]|nr:Ig-like domain-containing protein [Eubacteriales bacterium]